MTEDDSGPIIAIVVIIAFFTASTVLFGYYYYETNIEFSNYHCPNLEMTILNEDLIIQMMKDPGLLDAYMVDIHLPQFTFWTDPSRLVKYRVNKTSEICVVLTKLSQYGYNFDKMNKNNSYIGTRSYVEEHTLFKRKRDETWLCFENYFEINYKMLLVIFCKFLEFKHHFMIGFIITVITLSILVTITCGIIIFSISPEHTECVHIFYVLPAILCFFPTIMFFGIFIGYGIFCLSGQGIPENFVPYTDYTRATFL